MFPLVFSLVVRRLAFGVLGAGLIFCAAHAEMVYDLTPLDPSICGKYNCSRGWGINNQQLVIGEAWWLDKSGEIPIGTQPEAAVWDSSQINSNGISHVLQKSVPALSLSDRFLTALNDHGLACGG